MMIDPKSVSIPRRMRPLERDKRGYPVPYIVLRDNNNKPHFAVNDTDRVLQCIKEKRCAICGSSLDQVWWFAGGPLSAFHPHGSYMDSAMHHECMTYALMVCPYLAAPNYSGRIDAGTLDPRALPPDKQVFMDYSMLPDRPKVFVAVGTKSFEVTRVTPHGGVYMSPARPYESIEFWRGGQQLTEEEGAAAAIEAMGDIGVAVP